MFTLAGFADEISEDLNGQLDILKREQIGFMDLRGVWGKNILDLSDLELEAVKAKLSEQRIGISSIASPIGKIPIQDPFDEHLKKMEKAVKIAEFFNVRHIRIFSFFIPEGKDPDAYQDAAASRLAIMLSIAERGDKVLLHENEKEIYGDNAERCLYLMKELSSPNFKFAFDPANFVQCGVKPYEEAYPLLAPYIAQIHVKDALFQNGRVVPAGEGDGELADILAAALKNGYKGFLSLEPHLETEGKFSGFSGPDKFQAASAALKRLLDKLHMDWQ
ncbi:sugar phosphate isomerase/epimerase [Metabacillus sp. GX 13764]|uniref:sugar phosphate isomerase/epimerase family protein n=1 Tax=Metabacillus kandeliae TaxID=2900151 RepID=UPI001E3D6EEE|nr:sugar phosphate isomerase/epimerase family protein [Metabacillus kandeliae]MCD7035449.1 sugar phosphate isomerase/epimerase [Metabacillus kandeliae]